MTQQTHWITVTVKKITDQAMLVLHDIDEIWLPLSQIEDYSDEPAQGHEIEIELSDWIAREKGLVQ